MRRRRAARTWCSARPARSARLTRTAARSAFTCSRRWSRRSLVELTRTDSSSPLAAARAERFFAALGKHVAWVGDAPGLVLGRIVCQVINECAFSLGEGVGSAKDIDTGMVLGLSYPRGPLEWADTIGLDHVLDACSTRCMRSTARSAIARRRRCAAWCRPAGWDADAARASSSTTAKLSAATSRSAPPGRFVGR